MQEKQKLDWKQVKENLETIGVTYVEQEPPESLKNYITSCCYQAYPMVVDMAKVNAVDAELGVIVTHVAEEINNGVYIFTLGNNGTIGLMTVIPSTISKAPVIRGVVGDITGAITGVELPPLTPFDMVDITGQVLMNVIMKNLIGALNIPKEMEQLFIRVYLPRFLSNVANYQLGVADEQNKPVVMEEFVDMEPVILWEKLKSGEVPNFASQKSTNTTETASDTDTPNNKDTPNEKGRVEPC